MPVAGFRLHGEAGVVPEMDTRQFRAFVADIGNRGVLTPLDITAGGVVLDGRARLRAAVELGFERLPVRVVEPPDECEYMVLAALHRRALTPSQRAALAIELEPFLEARQDGLTRKRANLRGSGAEVATLPLRSGGEKSRELAARLAGVSPRTVQDALTVKEADGELFAAVKEGRVPAHRAAKHVRRAAQREGLSSPPLPCGPFDLLYADPPWSLGNPDSDRAPENHYPTMALGELKGLRVPTADDAVLFLWAVASHLPAALEVLEAWGFTYRTHFVWVKDKCGLGVWVRHRHELLLIGRRGTYSPPVESDRVDSVIEAPRGRHSEKPVLVYELVERMYPSAARVELFARTARPGWTAWGNEVSP